MHPRFPCVYVWCQSTRLCRCTRACAVTPPPTQHQPSTNPAQVVNTANDDAKAQALRCLRYVAKADGGVAALCEAGVIDTGVILLTGDDTATVARAQAVALLLALSSNFHNRVRLLYCGAVKSLITMLDSEESERGSKDKAAKLLSRLADVDVHDFRVQLQSARGMDVVLELLSSEHHRCQLASLSILTKMASKEAYRLEILEVRVGEGVTRG